jgi:hypothetical protein
VSVFDLFPSMAPPVWDREREARPMSREQLLKEVARVVRPGATVVIWGGACEESGPIPADKQEGSLVTSRILDALATFPGEWLTPWALARHLDDLPADDVVAAVRTLAAEGRVEVNRGVCFGSEVEEYRALRGARADR